MKPAQIRRQGSSAVMPLPSGTMKMSGSQIASLVNLEDEDKSATPAGQPRRRYSIAELLQGATSENNAGLNAMTAWARAGKPVGRELF